MPTTHYSNPAGKSGIPFKIGTLDGDIRRSFGTTSSTTTILCTVDFPYVDQFVKEMLGWSYLGGTLGSSGAQLKRVLPEKMLYRGNGSSPYQFALTAELVQNFGGATILSEDGPTNGWPQFVNSVVSVTYGAPLYKILADSEVTYEHERYCLYRGTPVIENERIPGAAFFIVDDALTAFSQQPLPDSGVKTGRVLNLEVKWLDVPVINYTKIMKLANRVNASSWTINGATYPAECVLFRTWSYEPRVNQLGILTNDITFKFGIRQDIDAATTQRTWNTAWLKSGTTVQVSHNGLSTGNKMFIPDDLNGLFSMGT